MEIIWNCSFFCKYTKEVGGGQDYIPFEVEVTRNCISKNTNENLVVFFMMELILMISLLLIGKSNKTNPHQINGGAIFVLGYILFSKIHIRIKYIIKCLIN